MNKPNGNNQQESNKEAGLSNPLETFVRFADGDDYETPLLERQSPSIIGEEIYEAIGGDRTCMQCSSCHGCSD